MAFNPDHAKRMRRAMHGSDRVVQIGIQSTSGADVEEARDLTRPERAGTATAIQAHMYRNAPYGGWKSRIPPDCDLQHLDWKAFEGEAPPHDFTPERFIHWRFYWDYSGGNVFENMVHQVGFWYKVLDLKIPESVVMCGDNYLSPGMEVPDTQTVAMHQSEKLLFTWVSAFGNNHYNIGESVLGNQGTVIRDGDHVHFVPEGGRRAHTPAAASEATPPPAAGPDIVGGGDITFKHMQNFIDCVRSRKQPNCPLEIGFRSAIACRMALTSLREGRKVSWDPGREEIV